MIRWLAKHFTDSFWPVEPTTAAWLRAVAVDRHPPIYLSPGYRPLSRHRLLVGPTTVCERLGPAVPADYLRSSISPTARSPERMAPSMWPYHRVAVSAPAQWIRPTGSRMASQQAVMVPGVG